MIFAHLQSAGSDARCPRAVRKLSGRCRPRDTLPLVGFTSWCAPPPMSSDRVHSGWRCRHRRSAGCHQPTRSALVVSHHLDGFLRVRTPGLVASRYRKGFAAFLAPVHRSSRPEGPWSGALGASPSAPSHPSKKSPLQQPHHIAVAVAPSPLDLRALPLPVLRGDPRPRGLAPLSGPLRPPPLPASVALSFHGLRSPPGC